MNGDWKLEKFQYPDWVMDRYTWDTASVGFAIIENDRDGRWGIKVGYGSQYIGQFSARGEKDVIRKAEKKLGEYLFSKSKLINEDLRKLGLIVDFITPMRDRKMKKTAIRNDFLGICGKLCREPFPCREEQVLKKFS